LAIKCPVDVSFADHDVFLSVNDHVCEYPSSLADEVDAYINFLAKARPGEDNSGLFLSLLISQVLWIQPAILFPDPLLEHYIPAAGDSEATRKNCQAIIHELLDLKISLADQPTIAEISGRHLGSGQTDWNEFREELIGTISPPFISICFSPVYFKEIITANFQDNLFTQLRDGLFFETGIKHPPFRICFDEELPYQVFYFKLNAYRSLPFIGLEDNAQLLVNETAERLALIGVKGKAAINPANGAPASFVDSDQHAIMDAYHIYSSDACGYFTLCLGGFLRKHGYMVVTKHLVDAYREKTALVYSKVNELIDTRGYRARAVKLLRLLARDKISIRNYRLIMEAVLEADHIIANAQEQIIFDERVPVDARQSAGWAEDAENLLEFVRVKLKRHISNIYLRGQSALGVFLVDPEIEKAIDPVLNEAYAPGEATRRKLIESVADEFEKLPANAQPPVILANINVRAMLRNIIAPRFPELAVLSFQELSPDLSVQQVGRIAF
jgi:type III secretory pathway component EscV